MIECILSIDYEIYGNGEGTLKDLVYEPTKKLRSVLDETGAKIVFFVEAAEFLKIEQSNSDPSIVEVRGQIHELYDQGHEIALHIHPQWCNAGYHQGEWRLDYTEYNLCVLSEERISEIVDQAICYLRRILGDTKYTPLSFRAGNWLLQPTPIVSKALAENGIKIDSSVFKGGLQHEYGLDYRDAMANGYFWCFQHDVNAPDPKGGLLEIPIYTRMVPFWKMATRKRISMQQKSPSGAGTSKQRRYRIQDMARFWQPLKFDFCRMTIKELTHMLDTIIKQDKKDPTSYKPVVAIGHTKDLVDFKTVQSLLAYLKKKGIPVSTFEGAYQRCLQ